MRLFSKRLMKIVVIILLLIIAFYIFHLNSLVKDEFSNPLTPSKNVNQIEYSIDDYPIDLINMLLLVEDQSFFNHHGVDFKEIARVLYGYLFEDKALRGASTISQQLIKNSLLSTNLDLDYVEILIRERFLFGKKDETIYLIKKDEK